MSQNHGGQRGNRDWLAINNQNCPRCGAVKGQQCNFTPSRPGPACCSERRKLDGERRKSTTVKPVT